VTERKYLIQTSQGNIHQAQTRKIKYCAELSQNGSRQIEMKHYDGHEGQLVPSALTLTKIFKVI